MYDIRQFKPAMYVLLVLGISGFALAAQAPLLWFGAVLAIGLNAWLVRTGRFAPLPRLIANVVTVLAFLYVAVQVRTLGPRAVLAIGQFLVLLQLIKLYEQRANRDFAQLLVLSLLLMVAAAINTASLIFGLMFITYLFLSLYCCLLFHLKVETDQARAAIATPHDELPLTTLRQDQRYLARSMRRLTGVVSLVSVVMAVVVFLFFPRGTGAGLLGPLQFKSSQTLTGFSENVGFNQVAKITQNNEVVAHVKVYRNEEPVQGGMTLLLRGLTLDVYNGNGGGTNVVPWQWTRTLTDSGPVQVQAGNVRGFSASQSAPGDSWRQEISLKPTGTPVLFGMAGVAQFKPSRTVDVAYGRGDETLRVSDRLDQPLTYELVSRGELAPLPFSPRRVAVEGALARSQIDPKIAEYARRPDVSGTTPTGAPLAATRPVPAWIPTPSDADAAICDAIQHHLQGEQFSYTLDLTGARNVIDGQDPIVAFLYDLKRGHCEYYAGAMALLCQSLGMDARVVIGFKCDEYNNTGGWYIVRQSHAHAWVEVRMPDGTWRTYDPTSGRDPREEAARNPSAWTRMKHWFDYLEQTWASKVVAYDRETRDNLVTSVDRQLINTAINSRTVFTDFRGFLDKAGLWLASHVIGPIIGLALLVLVGAVGWFLYEKWQLRRRAARIGLDALPDREKLRLARQLGFYDDLLRLLERRRIHRPPHLTPREFGDSLTFLPTDVFATVRRLTSIFYRIRFGGQELDPGQQQRLRSAIERLDGSFHPARG
jgi:protein-glutamine gamma-glutamyltransferase